MGSKFHNTWFEMGQQVRAAVPSARLRSFAFCPPFDARAASTIVRAHFSHVGTVDFFVLYPHRHSSASIGAIARYDGSLSAGPVLSVLVI